MRSVTGIVRGVVATERRLVRGAPDTELILLAFAVALCPRDLSHPLSGRTRLTYLSPQRLFGEEPRRTICRRHSVLQIGSGHQRSTIRPDGAAAAGRSAINGAPSMMGCADRRSVSRGGPPNGSCRSCAERRDGTRQQQCKFSVASFLQIEPAPFQSAAEHHTAAADATLHLQARLLDGVAMSERRLDKRFLQKKQQEHLREPSMQPLRNSGSSSPTVTHTYRYISHR
ncbi:hypothetical protein HPB50_010701 [Hyalomma asiaticum]|uniref:Uncharacterized protein n=1 Tax=Hyalomma asiaticum TaxID=266040 RepID=A0ACB7SDZ9_HYAAI|nr:hypothetical protein HPB50_010701 [Hyalomma asiaticum]